MSCFIRQELQMRVVCQSEKEVDITAAFPPMQFYIDGKGYDLLPENYIYGCGHGIDEMFPLSYTCALEIVIMPKLNIVILGDIFMRRYYTIFSEERKAIGFAKAKKRAVHSTRLEKTVAKGEGNRWKLGVLLSILGLTVVYLLTRYVRGRLKSGSVEEMMKLSRTEDVELPTFA
eukprot:TRINITY_DN7838_c0_g1_i2.p1 TRINITY_DN7838_c0_g1~~TRINITY_DN7838_c0_g1_i2.p1  ORF type:complete len:174 (+),score=38.63 TRINITY_DN7838_c0_g1_i2:198-719(+)